MAGIINSAVTALQGLFPRLFWLGVVVPVGLFAALHLGLAALTFAAVRKAIATAAESTLWVAALPLGVIVLAFLLQPLLPLLRGWLDGSQLHAALCAWLQDARIAAVRRRRAEWTAARDVAGAFADAERDGDRAAAAAHAAGTALPRAADEAATAAAETAIAAARKPLDRGQLPDAAALQAAVAATGAALRANNPDPVALQALDPTAPAAALALSARTGKAGEALVLLLSDAREVAEERFKAATDRLRGVPLDAAVQPTRMGEARRAAERYAEDAYGADFAFLGPRLLIHLPKDSVIAEQLVAAQAALNAAVLSVFLAVTLLPWLGVLAVHGESWVGLALVALGAPALAWGCLRLAIEAQFGLGEALKLAIDRHRLDVLKELHQPIPASRHAERELWGRIARAQADPRVVDLPYAPPPGDRSG
jgi:hypothetical protein